MRQTQSQLHLRLFQYLYLQEMRPMEDTVLRRLIVVETKHSLFLHALQDM